jgi:cation diffusion facilitator CzcD-associated flavoprotein CzcO
MNTHFQVGIIGAGLAGISIALKLKQKGITSFILLERAAEGGGVWRDNIYPGCACDVAAPLYSFSAEPNPDWSSLYASQSDILSYINHVIDKNQLREYTRFNTNITSATFNREYGCWQLADTEGNQMTVKVLILALGRLNKPLLPEFKNLHHYSGKVIHSSQWDSSYQFRDKHIAVIGTGASAVQIIPSLAGKSRHLTVFQRSAPWISGRNNLFFSASVRGKFKRNPVLMELTRKFFLLQSELLGTVFFGPKWIKKLVEQVMMRKLNKSVRDPGTREKLKPNYELGCKRVMRSDDYYPVFNRPDVTLETDQIESFTSNGIRMMNGKLYPLDAVIMATGFEAAKMNFEIDVTGLGGQNLKEVWQHTDAACYKGMITSGFPNMAFVAGPNSGSPFGSSLLIMEYQSDYIASYINQICNSNKNIFMDLHKEVQDRYVDHLRRKFKTTVWASAGCTSWQFNSKRTNVIAFPGLSSEFRKITRKLRTEEYMITFCKFTYAYQNISGES